jgi:ribosomal protein L31E
MDSMRDNLLSILDFHFNTEVWVKLGAQLDYEIWEELQSKLNSELGLEIEEEIIEEIDQMFKNG